MDLFGEEPLLRSLVDEAMHNNPDLKATALRLKAAGYLLAASRAAMLPHITIDVSAGRDNQGVDEITGEQTPADLHRLSLGMSWELDLWGRLADSRAASQQAVLEQKSAYLQLRDALAARVIQAWVEQVAAWRLLAVAKERVAVLQRIETVQAERFKGGIGVLDDFSTAKSRTEIARADLSARKASVWRAVRKLEVLLGRYPQGALLSDAELPVLLAPPVAPPAGVLLHRPDIRAALARAEAAAYLSRAADKALLPELRLSAQVFKQAARLGVTECWSVLGSLFQPLYEGGRLKSEARARRTEAEASLMDLHHVVLQALKEAENAFDLERDLAVQNQALQTALHASEKSSRYYEQRYRQGLDTIQSWLIAKEQEMDLRIRLREVAAERLANRVELALALGVGLKDAQALRTGADTP